MQNQIKLNLQAIRLAWVSLHYCYDVEILNGKVIPGFKRGGII